MIILIDNYDSFSYNLYQLVGTIDPDIKVIRNDELTVDEIRALKPSRIILSPGPGFPKDAGICVCLGHQAICEAYGATVSYAKELMHGKQSTITIDETCPIFQGMGNTMKAARYHSLAAVKETIPETLKVTAKTKDGEVMAVMHREYPIYGVQFHPESILTPDGKIILSNFLMQASKVSNYHANT